MLKLKPSLAGVRHMMKQNGGKPHGEWTHKYKGSKQ